MSHLSPERLAALADETPTPIEAAHLTTCDDCASEAAAQRKLSRLAAAAGSGSIAPLSNFDALVPRMRAEGLIDPADRRAKVRQWALRIAAAVGFVVVGAGVGRMSAGAPLPLVASSTGTSNPVALVQEASNTGTTFRSADEAVKAMQASQLVYQNAAAFLASQDTTQHFNGLNTEAYRTRLAALDDMAAASRTALYRAPQDPLLNQYYLAFQAAREQTLQQLAVSLPAKRQLGRY